jgi:hypothetical protein
VFACQEAQGRASRPRLLGAVAAVVLLACRAIPAWAVEPDPGPPRLEAVSVEQGPVIDGALDDACWQAATRVKGFSRVDKEGPEFEPTEAWLCHDAHSIYVGFYCHDSRPAEIQALQRKRGGDISQDDAATISLDVNCDHRTAYAFGVTARGTQVETIPGGSAAKYEWRGDWRAAARVVEDGWTAELAIPFSILRYPERQQTFGVHFGRYLARMTDWSCWPDLGRSEDLTRDAQWVGLAAPKHREPVILMPYGVFDSAGGEDEGGAGGFDSKYTMSNGLVTMLSYQPDFRNIEDVVQSIDFTYAERQLPEYRPFFAEGGGSLTEWGTVEGSYYPPPTIFYSRRIATLDLGAKVFGKLGRDRLGFLWAGERGTTGDWVLAYGRDVGARGLLELGVVDHREAEGLNNQAVHLGTDWSWPMRDGGAYANADFYRGRTEGAGGDDGAVSVNAGTYKPNGIGYNAWYQQVGRDFQNVVEATEWGTWRQPVGVGYVPYTDTSSTGFSASGNQSFDSGWLERRGWDCGLSTAAYATGEMVQLNGGYSLGLRNDTSWRLGAVAGKHTGFSEQYLTLSRDWHNKDMYARGSVSGAMGNRQGGPYRFVQLTQAYRPTQDFSWQLRLEQVRLDAPSPESKLRGLQALVTATYDVSDERSISARLVYRKGNANFWLPQVYYDWASLPAELQGAPPEQEAAKLNMYLAYRQQVTRGRDIFIIVGDPNAPGTQARIAVKVMSTWSLRGL